MRQKRSDTTGWTGWIQRLARSRGVACELFGGSNAGVVALERGLGVRLPADVRKFATDIGGLQVGSRAVSLVNRIGAGAALDNTVQMREIGGNPIVPSEIVIYMPGDGTDVLLDCSTGRVEWRERSGDVVGEYPSFREFLSEMILV